VESITVRWPSGKETRYGAVNEGTLVTAYENREGGAFEESPYRTVEVPEVATARREKFPAAQESPAKLHVYTTTATWCAACKGHLPTWERLGEEEGVAIFGVPVDPEDDAAKLASYVEEWKPAYQMLADLDDTQRGVVTSFLGRRIGLAEAPLPSTVITDAEGGVLEVMMGVPTLSDLRRLLDANR
jgi:thiol-disulfide isomerase/thioredoxin